MGKNGDDDAIVPSRNDAKVGATNGDNNELIIDYHRGTRREEVGSLRSDESARTTWRCGR